jgi:hypothetical protein
MSEVMHQDELCIMILVDVAVAAVNDGGRMRIIERQKLYSTL